jgi:hypothetical protein
MHKFLVLYLSPMSAGEQMGSATPEQAQAGMDAWMAWARAAGDAVVDLGSPLQHAVSIPSGASARAGLHVGGYSVMQAESADVLRGTLGSHPHLMIPGNVIEVHEVLAMPGA